MINISGTIATNTITLELIKDSSYLEERARAVRLCNTLETLGIIKPVTGKYYVYNFTFILNSNSSCHLESNALNTKIIGELTKGDFGLKTWKIAT